jgi:hypothetical protein
MKEGLVGKRLPKSRKKIIKVVQVVGFTLSQIVSDASVPHVGDVRHFRLVRLRRIKEVTK